MNLSKKAAAQPPAREAPQASLAVASAFQALKAGTANAHQQQIALEWLVRDAGGKGHSPFYGEHTHDTAFMLGRHFVADLVVGLFHADLSALRRATNANVQTTSRSS